MSAKRIHLGTAGIVFAAVAMLGLVFSFYSVRAAGDLAPNPIVCEPPGAGDPGTSSLVSYWPLDETAGATSFTDDGAASHDGSCTGVTCPTSGATGIASNALDFLASDSDVVVVGSDTDYDFTTSDDVSVGLWVKTSQDCSGTPNNKVFFGRYRDTAGNGTWWVGCVPDGGDSTKGLAAFHLRDSDDVVGRAVGTSKINDGQWHYLVGVRDGTANKNYIYVDGVLEGTVTSPGYTGTFAGDDDLTMGAYDVTGPGYHYQGLLDEVTFYGRMLSGPEIGDYNDVCNPVTNTPPTVGDVSFNTPKDTPLEITEAELLANSSDPDGDTLSVDSVDGSSTQGGTITGALPGPFTYTPPAGYTGPDSFNFSVTDSTDSVQGTANIQVDKLKYYLPIIQLKTVIN